MEVTGIEVGVDDIIDELAEHLNILSHRLKLDLPLRQS